jgi:regulator of protease activity HflC (stomatin/prohibitin superfamily)
MSSAVMTWRLLLLTVIMGALSAVLLGGARWTADPLLRVWCSEIAAALILVVAGLLPAWMLSQGRALSDTMASLGAGAAPAATSTDSSGRADAVDRGGQHLRSDAGWPQGLVVLIPSLTALLVATSARPAPASGSGVLIPAVALLALACALIVIDRLLADVAARVLPERDALRRLVAVPSTLCVLGGASLVACHMGWAVVWVMQWPAAILVVLVAVELALRATAHLIVGTREPRSCADSLLSGALTARRAPLAAIAAGVRDRFGIDLARSWSARVIARAAPWVALSLVLLGWLLTAVTLVPIGSRVVLQGADGAQVLGVGLHAHAPWPLQTTALIEDGRIHETVLGDGEAPLPAIGAQAEPLPAYDRLWEIAHPAEAEVVVPARSSVGSSPSFQVVAGDVRVRWTVGSSDADALAAVSMLAEPEVAVARSARRALTALCAVRTLSELMGEDRDRLGEQLCTQVQADIDRPAGGRSGIVVVAILFDAIHPPVGASPAYQQVQAAEITALGTVARARADAVRLVAEASIDATDRHARAQATAAEATSAARASAVRFAAEAEAWRTHHDALATERWLEAIQLGLAGKPVLLLDHHLDLHDLPVGPLRLLSPEVPP